ncbi:DUF397 domain-containing protein [Streptomyces sp. NPDC018045]|uniref:DUF397 domain-containing protein n=1 Tax=Streptomyces sp. NPDC018045 TaxID=3365037 RepID=UPI0037A3CC88
MTTRLPAGQLAGATWRKSRHSAADNECVEIAQFPSAIAVRDSKVVARQPLVFPRAAFAEFVAGCRAGHWGTPD